MDARISEDAHKKRSVRWPITYGQCFGLVICNVIRLITQKCCWEWISEFIMLSFSRSWFVPLALGCCPRSSSRHEGLLTRDPLSVSSSFFGCATQVVLVCIGALLASPVYWTTQKVSASRIQVLEWFRGLLRTTRPFIRIPLLHSVTATKTPLKQYTSTTRQGRTTELPAHDSENIHSQPPVSTCSLKYEIVHPFRSRRCLNIPSAALVDHSNHCKYNDRTSLHYFDKSHNVSDESVPPNRNHNWT